VSIDSVLARMNALQSLFDTAGGVAPAPAASTPGADFASTLDAAASTPAPANATFDALPTAAATPTTSALGADVPYGAEITAAAQRNGLDPALLAGLIKQESGFDANARSSAGAVGLTQLMPGTAAGLGVNNTLDPAQAIEGGAKYLKQQLDRFGGDVARALAAYNAGPGAVERFGGVPPYAETQNYVRNVQANAAAFRSSTPTA
jgi:soluble lytic murein transglycosylase-like protein